MGKITFSIVANVVSACKTFGHGLKERTTALTEDGYIQVTHRELPYTTFDADNHLYENRDALTKFLPREYEGLIKYVDINGRTKLAIRDRISD